MTMKTKIRNATRARWRREQLKDEIICPYCKEPFKRQRRNHIYCSRLCKSRHYWILNPKEEKTYGFIEGDGI